MSALLHPCIGLISQVIVLIVVPTAPGGLGGDGADSAVPRCFQCCIQFYHLCYCYFYHCTTRFTLSCSCWLSNDACYIPWFYQLRVLLCKMLCQKWRNKTVKSISTLALAALLMHTCITDLGYCSFTKWLAAYLVPSLSVNQQWLLINIDS